jgi:hypothetical protein
MLTFISASSYSIDLPYITFGQKESKSDTKSNDKNMDKMTNPDNKDAQFSFRRVTEDVPFLYIADINFLYSQPGI